MTSRSGSRLQLIIWLAALGVCGAVLSLAGAYLYLNPQIPSAESFRHVRLETPLRIYTEDRVLMGEFGERRVVPITLDQVPPLFIRALIDTEDKRFYEHNGIDFISFLNDALDFAIHREIAALREAGLSNWEVLDTGTRLPGEYVRQYMHADHDFGVVRVGARADLVLLDGNPLADLETLRRPAGVMTAGRWYTGEALRAELEALRVLR